MAECRLSVVVPCRNYGQYLSDAIESVLQQEGFGDQAEVIVVNDHSTDSSTLECFSYWRTADPRVRVIDNPGRLGAAAARNLGIAEARGEWIAFLDADDVWVPGALQTRWRVLDTHPEAQWIGADFKRLRQDGTSDAEGFFKTRSVDHPRLRHACESGAVLKLVKPVPDFLQMSLGWTSTVLAKKALLLRVGGFEALLGNYEDHHLWIRLARHTDFYFVPEVVALYRDHPSSVSRREGPPAYWYIVALRMLLRDPHFRPYRTLIRRKLAFLFAQNMYYHRTRGERGRAIAAAAQSVLRHPSRMSYWKNLLAVFVRRR
ncbi:MAG TPA: glycosyltransferase family 2 protein [Candidatus Binatia bacterium]|jgi:glycosyltransferase involved in cell wall biosynthesis